MARQTDSFLVITGELVAETPLHVGGFGSAAETDLPLAIDGRGDFYVPGTSLAGAIRAWLDRMPLAVSAARDDGKPGGNGAPGQGPSRALWGQGATESEVRALEKKEREQGKLSGDEKARLKKAQGFASRVFVHDAHVKGRVAVEIRDHVGIDRGSGTAHVGIKYDRQILPRGTRLDFRMEVEFAARDSARLDERQAAFERDEEADRRWVAATVQALGEGRIRFGAAKTRGLGRLRLVNAAVGTFDVNQTEGILSLVRTRAGALAARPASADGAAMAKTIVGEPFTPALPPLVRVSIDWVADGPVMVKSGTDGLGVDMLPLVSGVEGGRLAMVLPGSAIKGSWRAHAERIGLTLGLGHDDGTVATQGNRDRFLKQLARVRLVETLFGIPGPKYDKTRRGKPGDGDVRGLGAVFVDDCFAENRRTTVAKWQGLADAPKDDEGGMTHVRAALEAMKWASDDPAAHVAIDRWTGGAADGALYSALEPRGVDWGPIEIEMALDRLKPPPGNADEPLWREAAIALFLLTLRDFAGGRIPLGFGGNRGYGALCVTAVTFKVEGTQSDLATPAIARLDGWAVKAQAEKAAAGDGGLVSALADPERLKALDASWRKYLETMRAGGPARSGAQ